MNEKENARPVAATTERAGETAALGGTSISLSNSITKQNEKQGKIEALLGRGSENRITTGELVILAGLRSARELQAEIERERAAGALILSSSSGGYYLPSDDPAQARQEIERFVATVHARALNTQRTLRAARRALRECIGQMEVGEK